MSEITIRPASAADQPAITAIIRAAGINRAGLEWRRFLVAEENGRVVGVGQVKPHGDGSRELASIAVIPERQGRGIATCIIRALLAREDGTLYLRARSEMQSFYERFGFQLIGPEEMPPSFVWFYRFVQWVITPISRLFIRGGVRLIVMRREP